MGKLTAAVLAAGAVLSSVLVQAQELRGSRASMERQYRVAVSEGYAFVSSSREVNDYADAGRIVKVDAGRHFELHRVSFPYALPEVKLFLERLSALYQLECGEKLTVTSLMRPQDRQPVNAADDSVHPTGMAIDLRIPSRSRCRSWLESTLLTLEGAEVLDVTRERYPPHYHVAVFPQTYALYAAGQSEIVVREYTVRRGDSLSLIARRTGVSVAELRTANGIRGDLIRVGQKLILPGEVLVPGLLASQENGMTAEVTHRVRRGDTLWRIARTYGTTVETLRRDNGLSGDFLQVGNTLKVVVSGAGSL